MYSQRTPLRSPIINVMSRAVMKAAKGLLRDFGEIERLQVSQKSLGHFVSSADIRTEKILQEELQTARPQYGVLMEEGGEIAPEQSDYTWIIDPLDGTNNFLHGIPHFAISIALAHHQQVIAAITYDPVKDEMFCAEKGSGAYMNDKRLRVSKRHIPSEMLISTGPCFVGKDNSFSLLESLQPHLYGFRRMGASALDLAYVAAGRLDAFIETHPLVWDSAAGVLLIQEAGGRVSTTQGNNRNQLDESLIASNGLVHNELLKFWQ